MLRTYAFCSYLFMVCNDDIYWYRPNTRTGRVAWGFTTNVSPTYMCATCPVYAITAVLIGQQELPMSYNYIRFFITSFPLMLKFSPKQIRETIWHTHIKPREKLLLNWQQSPKFQPVDTIISKFHHPPALSIHLLNIFFFCVLKGPAADATDAPQPWGLLYNPVMKMTERWFSFFFHFFK